MPFSHSAGTCPECQTFIKSQCNTSQIGVSTHFSSSTMMLSHPAARPFLSFLTVRQTSDKDGGTIHTHSDIIASYECLFLQVGGVCTRGKVKLLLKMFCPAVEDFLIGIAGGAAYLHDRNAAFVFYLNFNLHACTGLIRRQV